MPEDNNKKDKNENAYDLLLAEINALKEANAERDSRIAKIEADNKSLVELNRSLLSTKGVNKVDNPAKEKLDKYLKGE